MIHYSIINEILDFYIVEGVNPVDFLSYLNKAEENFKLIYNKVLSKCTVNGLTIDEDQVLEDLKESIRDRIAFVTDVINTSKNSI